MNKESSGNLFLQYFLISKKTSRGMHEHALLLTDEAHFGSNGVFF